MPPCRPLVANAYRACRLSSILDPEIAEIAFRGEKVGFSQSHGISTFYLKSQKITETTF